MKNKNNLNKAFSGAYNKLNPRTVSTCNRYMAAGIAGEECKMVIQQAQQMERMSGRKIFDIDFDKLAIYSILPKIRFGMTERNIIYIKNYYELPQADKYTISNFFDDRGVAKPGMSKTFIKDFLPKGRQEKRMFEAFNIIHGMNLEITPEGYIFMKDFPQLDSATQDLLEFYFTPQGYAKMYFQNGFLSRFGLKIREHKPSPIKTRNELLYFINKLESKEYSTDQCRRILLDKNPSLKTDIEYMDIKLANIMVNRYLLYTKMSNFMDEDVKFLGTTSEADKYFRLTEHFESESDAISVTFYKDTDIGIGVADQYANNAKELIKYLQIASDANWIPEGCNKLEYIIGHEFAHALIQIYDLSRDPIIRAIETKLMNKGLVGKEVSLNAHLNTKEFIADCWSEYVNSESPREAAMQIGDRILEFLQKKVLIL
jgi:hypothetical protein